MQHHIMAISSLRLLLEPVLLGTFGLEREGMEEALHQPRLYQRPAKDPVSSTPTRPQRVRGESNGVF